MEGENIKVYTSNCQLIIDSKILKIRTIIPYQNIESITMTHVNETYDNEMLVSLSKPVEYENLGTFFVHKIIYAIYLLFRTNRNSIRISYSDNDLLLILNEIKDNLLNVNIPASFDKSLFWNENSDNHNFFGIKLVYSKLNLSLLDILRETNKIQHK